MNQCLKRDSGWKTYYDQQMSALASSPAPPKALDTFVAEHSAEKLFQSGKSDKAITELQALMDKEKIEGSEQDWYLQEMARYAHAFDKDKSNELQIAAHQLNRYLFKAAARYGIRAPISAKGQKRIERIRSWAKEFESAEDLLVGNGRYYKQPAVWG